MNATRSFPVVIVKQPVLTMTDHSLVPATMGLQEMESHAEVYYFVIYSCTARDFLRPNSN